MKSTIIKKTLKLGFIAALAVASAPLGVYAATQSVTANIAFDTPLTLTKVADVNFGTVSAGVADTYTITTAGVVTAARNCANSLPDN